MRRGIKILLLSDTWAILALGMLGPIYALFVKEIGGSLLDASWAYFAFMITSGIVLFLISRWEDHVKHKEKLIVIGYSLTAVGCIMYFFVNSQTMLIVTQVVLGLAEAVLAPAFDAMYSIFLDRDQEASEWGVWEAMRYIVTAIAAVAGGYLADTLGFRALFIFMFIIAIFSVASSLLLFKSKKYLNAA